MISVHRHIFTQQKHAPWSWLILANMAWMAMSYSLFVTSVALPLTLLRFTDDTRVIAFVTSVGGLMGIIIGPLCNFISDRLWTRWGRRRPFLLVAMAGTFTAMALTPYMPSLVPLVLLTVISSLLGDVGSTFEPLWLEIIPPEQRGRGFVVRFVCTHLASVYFFQIMFAQWDNHYHIDLTRAGLGMVVMTGEQMTYLAAAVLKLYVIVFLLCLVREVHPEGVELKRWSQIDFNPIRFAKDFLLNVFGDKRWWPIYVYYVAPSIMGAGIGTFSNLMQVNQWKFAKSSMALMGWAPMLVAMFVAAPILGRQADSFKRYPRWALAGIAAAGIAACWSIVHSTYPGLSPSQLPPFWALMSISLTLSATGLSLVFLLTQEFNRATPSQNRRLWPWFLGPINILLGTLFVLWYVRVHLAGKAPPIAHWFLIVQITGAMGGFSSLAGPLLYEYMPGDKIGTLSSGFGLISTAIGSTMSVIMGFWIYYFTLFFGNSHGQKDYSSYLLAILVTAPVSIGFMIYFLRIAQKGQIIEYGRLRLNSDGHPMAAETPAECLALEEVAP